MEELCGEEPVEEEGGGSSGGARRGTAAAVGIGVLLLKKNGDWS